MLLQDIDYIAEARMAVAGAIETFLPATAEAIREKGTKLSLSEATAVLAFAALLKENSTA
jgi:hypothetical protein